MQALEWRPEIPLGEGIASAYKWFLENALTKIEAQRGAQVA